MPCGRSSIQSGSWAALISPYPEGWWPSERNDLTCRRIGHAAAAKSDKPKPEPPSPVEPVEVFFGIRAVSAAAARGPGMTKIFDRSAVADCSAGGAYASSPAEWTEASVGPLRPPF